jgi:beta-glucanase (GH16 family)
MARNALSLLVLVLALGFAVAWGSERRGPDPSATDAGGRPDRDARAPRGSRLLMRDDFDGTQLNTGLWNTCHWWERTGCTIATNHELERYWPGQVVVGGGIVSLVAEPATSASVDPAHPFASGMIASGPPHGSRRAKFAFRYGIATIRARIPTGAGLWPAFWLLPANRNSEPEIDVMEIHGDTPETVRMHLHYRNRKGRERSRGARWTDPSIPSGWHTFSVNWRRGKLTWLIDGIPRFRVKGRSVPRKRMYPIANLAVGGKAPGPPTAETPFPSEYDIDYIEVRK